MRIVHGALSVTAVAHASPRPMGARVRGPGPSAGSGRVGVAPRRAGPSCRANLLDARRRSLTPIARNGSARAQRGSEAATSRPALGFALDRMTLADVKAWAESQHVNCEDVRGGLLRCTDVPVVALGGSGPLINRLDFGFTLADQRLVNLSAWRNGLTSVAAAAQMDAVVASMRERVGAPSHEEGRRSAQYLAAGPLHTTLVQYRFKDYIADVSATNIPGRGLSLREHYMSARD